MEFKNKITKKNVEYMEVWNGVGKIANIEIHRKIEDIIFYAKVGDACEQLTVEEKNELLKKYKDWIEKQSFRFLCFVLEGQFTQTEEWDTCLQKEFQEHRLWVQSSLKKVEKALREKGDTISYLYKEERRGICEPIKLKVWTEQVIEELQNEKVLVDGKWTKAGNFSFHFEDNGSAQMFPIFYPERCEIIFAEERLVIEPYEKGTLKTVIGNILESMDKKNRLQKLFDKKEQKHFFGELSFSPINEKMIVRKALLSKMTDRELEILSLHAKKNNEIFVVAKEGRFNSIRMFGYKIAFDANGFVIAEQDEEFFEKLRGLLLKQNEQTIQKLQTKWAEKDDTK